MYIADEPFWERTLRRIRQIWPLGETAAWQDKIAADLPEGDLPEVRKKIDECLLGTGGEVSARMRAAELGETYSLLNEVGRKRFLVLLAEEYGVPEDKVEDAINIRREAVDSTELQNATTALRDLLEPPRLKLLRQFNELEEGVKFLVDLRVELMSWAKEDHRLKALDHDVYRLLSSWFDVGFLNLQQITWRTPAAILEKLIEYEAVHRIRSWQDLKHRLEKDHLCYAFFHPRMPDEPLIFVEVALVKGIARNIHKLLDENEPAIDPARADTAIFYSISNCQRGLAGVSFGNFLIKRVVADLSGKMKNIKQFCTLSPIPGFTAWLRKQQVAEQEEKERTKAVEILLDEGCDHDILRKVLEEEAVVMDKTSHKSLQPALLALCAEYLLRAKRHEHALDRVAHFHLTNGARVEQINWAADLSERGVEQSVGLMVNYLYDISQIEKNHEMYVSSGEIAASASVQKLLR